MSLVAGPDPDLPAVSLESFLLRVVDEEVEESVIAFQVARGRLHLGHEGDGALAADQRRRKRLDLSGEEHLALPEILLLVAFGDRVFVVAVDVAVGQVVDVAPVTFVSLRR